MNKNSLYGAGIKREPEKKGKNMVNKAEDIIDETADKINKSSNPLKSVAL